MRAIGAGTRVFEVLDRKSLIPLHKGIELSPDRRGTIRFEHVHFEYPTRKDVKILKDFNLEINVGETVAIVCVIEGFCFISVELFVQWGERWWKVIGSFPVAPILRSQPRKGSV